ncbi:CRISPR-associated helicase Cas3' [Desulfonatronum parangueonense]
MQSRNQDLLLAHADEDGRTHDLQAHLLDTATLAEGFADAFGCPGWGRLAGLWHDIGKSSFEFQNYLLNNGGRTDHSTAGAIHAVDQLGIHGRVLAYLIAGHHAGLPDWQGDAEPLSTLVRRLNKRELLERLPVLPSAILDAQRPQDRPPRPATRLAASLWLRMLFSCLVDADFLDTEAFFDQDKAKQRGRFASMAELLERFTVFMRNLEDKAPDTPVNRKRREIAAQCMLKAEFPQGFFSLTVPTGGGKTLATMVFALRHACRHGLRRVIYVIPYTSIIEQTADLFRKIFPDSVVEHHSNVVLADDAQTGREGYALQLAAENWDAPIIVTTSVQFFESLFASRTSRCRKLHNIVNSVVVLDEAQLLPTEHLSPILEALTELQQGYGVTVIFSTATQPAFDPQPAYQFKGIDQITEIIDDPPALDLALRRTSIRKFRDLEPISWDELAAEINAHDSALCIVNRRDDARTLWEMMPPGTIHLSALMCGMHRSRVIGEIKARLSRREPTRVISTQLVEAGVDVDFPVVFRAASGLDSIAQAAGRCNREGLRERGFVYVFTPPSRIPAGYLRQAAGIGMRLLNQLQGDVLTQKDFTDFFRELYWLKGEGLDSQDILKLLGNDREMRFSFRSAAGRFKIIDDLAQAAVIVQYDNSELLDRLERRGPERLLMRRLQRYVVNIPRRKHLSLMEAGAIREVYPGIFIQIQSNLYHQELGLCPDRSLVYEPDELLC